MISRVMDYLSCGASIVDILINRSEHCLACRVKANPKNAINEHFLPRFLDFIVWGHEHECLVDPLVASPTLPLKEKLQMDNQQANLIKIECLLSILFLRKFLGWDFTLHNQVPQLQHH